MTTHNLKTWPASFQDIVEGRKTFELRKFDRDFKAGDTLRLQEWDPRTRAYTGREMEREITYLASSGEWLKEGVCAMAITKTPEPLNETQKAVDERLRPKTTKDMEEIEKLLGAPEMATHFKCSRCGREYANSIDQPSPLCPDCGRDNSEAGRREPAEDTISGRREAAKARQQQIKDEMGRGAPGAAVIAGGPHPPLSQVEPIHIADHLRKQLADAQSRIKELAQVTKVLDGNIDVLERSLRQARGDISSYETTHDADVKRIQELERAHADAEKRAADWESATQSAGRSYESDLKTLRSRLADTQQRLADARKEIDFVKSNSRPSEQQREIAQARERIAVLEEHDLQWQQNALKIRKALGLSIHSNDSLVDTATNLLNDRDRLRLERTEAYAEHNRLVGDKNKALAAMDKVTADRAKLLSICEKARPYILMCIRSGSTDAADLIDEIDANFYPNSPNRDVPIIVRGQLGTFGLFRCNICSDSYPVKDLPEGASDEAIIASRACPKCGRKPTAVS